MGNHSGRSKAARKPLCRVNWDYSVTFLVYFFSSHFVKLYIEFYALSIAGWVIRVKLLTSLHKITNLMLPADPNAS